MERPRRGGAASVTAARDAVGMEGILYVLSIQVGTLGVIIRFYLIIHVLSCIKCFAFSIADRSSIRAGWTSLITDL